MRVFLTGGSGFLGAEATRLLVEAGHECAVLLRGDIEATRLAPLAARLHAIRGDLFAPESYREALTNFAPDALLHSGWRGVAGAERNDLGQLDNIVATGRLAAAAADAGARILIGVGSQAEYGLLFGRVAEDAATEPTTLYGVAKLAAGRALLAIAAERGLRAAWGRVFSLYGPGEARPWLVPSLIRSFAAGRSPDLTACEQIWEFTHVCDAAAALLALLDHEAHGVFNIGSGEPTPLRDAVLLLRDLTEPGVAPRFGSTPYRPDQIMHLEADISRICAATGWRPRVPLARGFAETVEWFRSGGGEKIVNHVL
ncbi:NAD(P)-dependent oxidoreductase [Methylosinus sp. RM1]|uniref:NAD-dependent epimerase/dehydratase family protein n=1 Tax=Methylosinus sp. RM1 TaxID=2583817 RepID=UPI00140BAB46|nr:NAD(P)-dependent oxidoreductase [Methylosinus sp. RM1]